jgi:hypothetical protein
MKLIIYFLILPFITYGQIITTVAGPGTALGDGGPATSALIDDPCGIIFNKNDELYISLGNGNRIRKIDASGIITTIAGIGTQGYSGDGGQATAAKLNFPDYVALDLVGNIFIADGFNHAIRRIDIATGIITTICGNGTSGYSGDNGPATAAKLYGPSGICFDKTGNLYIADCDNNVIRKIDVLGIITTIAGTGVYGYNGDNIAATSAQLHLPTDIRADNEGNIYIADLGNYRIRKINTTGFISTYAGNGNYIYNGDGMPATNAQFTPCFIALDKNENLYISDRASGNYRVYKIDNSGIFHTVAGNGGRSNTGDGGPATMASIYEPSGLAFDTCNNLYVGNITSSGDSDMIRKVALNPDCLPESVHATTTVSNIKIYPNPATNTLHIDGVTQSGQRYKIISVVGAVLLQGTLKQGSNSIDIKTLADGVYMVEVGGSDEGKKVVKMIKQ